MEGGAEFLPKLEQTVEARQRWLDEYRGPELVAELRAHVSHFQGLVAMLTRKGLIRDNPEAYVQQSAKAGLPTDDPFPDAEKRETVSWRLMMLRRCLEETALASRQTTADLDGPRVKRLAAAVSWIPWPNLSEQTSSPTSKAVAQHVNSIRLGSDRVTAVVAKDFVNQLARGQRRITEILADFALFDRERWKLEARRRLLPKVHRDKAGKLDELRKSARRQFAALMPGETFHPDLFDEIVAEDSAERGELLRADLIARLAKTEEPAPVPTREPPRPDRQPLLEAVRAMARAEGEMASAVATLVVNAERSSGIPRGLRGILRRLLRGLGGTRRRPRVLEIERPSPDRDEPMVEKVELDAFLESCRREVELLASLGEDGGVTWSKLAPADDAQLAQFVEGQIAELLVLTGRMAGVNAKLQASMPPRDRREMRGIRLEMAAVKNFIMKAEDRRREYAKRVEDHRQWEQLTAANAPGPSTPDPE